MMKRIDTDMQKNDLLFPTRREVLNELHKRDGLDSKLISEFNRLEAGYDGEELVFDYLNQFGQSDWVVCRNLWLDYYGEFEIDLLLITDSRIYTFEIKHFSGVYEFKNNQCLRNGQKSATTRLVRLKNRLSIFKIYLNEMDFSNRFMEQSFLRASILM